MSTRYLFLGFLLNIFTPLLLLAGDSKLEREADKLYAYFDFMNAVKLYQKVLSNEPDNTAVKEKIANSYRLMNNTLEAERWYGEILKVPGTSTVNKFYYAQSLRSNEKYDLALKYFSEYMASENKTYAKEFVLNQKKWQDLMRPNNSINVKNLLEINSPQSEFSPMFYRDSSIIFVSNAKSKTARFDDWSQTTFLDLYVSYVGTNKTNEPKPFASSKINGSYHEGPVTFTKGYGAMYITRSNYENNKYKKGSDNKTVTLKVFKVNYEKSVDNWSKVTEALPFNSNDYNVCHPAFSLDNQYLIFASDMPGGYGGTDLWISQNLGNDWSKPKNLGPIINTPGEEKFPFISADGHLYFASDGHYGLGGLDIYKSKIKIATGTCERPENMGIPFNSSKDDFGFIVDRYNFGGYFSSNRPGGLGEDDIYRWENKSVFINVHVADDKNNDLKTADLKLLCKGLNPKQLKTEAEGVARFEVIPDCNCTLKVSKPGYKPKTFTVKVMKKPIDLEVKLDKNNKPELKLEIMVLNKENNEPMPGVSISVKAKKSGEKINSSTDKEGKLLIAGVDENIELEVTAYKATDSDVKKFLYNTKVVSTVGRMAPAYLKEIIFLEMAERNVPIKLQNVNFDQFKYDLKEQAYADLDRVVKIMKDNPTLEIEIGNHTDCRGNAAYNMNLSSKRSEVLANYIVSKGIEIKRIIATGYGESELLNDCKCEGATQVNCSEGQHQLNRRTEFKILKF